MSGIDYSSLNDYSNSNFLNKPKPFQMPQVGRGAASPSILDSNSFAVKDNLFDPKSFNFSTDALNLGNDNGSNVNDINDPKSGAFSNYVIPGLDALSGLTQAYTGYQALGLAEDQFDLGKAQYNRDLKNQSDVFNLNLEASQRRGMGDEGLYDQTTDAGRAKFEQDLARYVQENSIDGSAI